MSSLYIFRICRQLLLGSVLTLALLSPGYADLGDAVRFEDSVRHIAQLAKSRPDVDRLLQGAVQAVPHLGDGVMTLAGLSSHLAQSHDEQLYESLVRGMLASLDDKWARLYTPEQSRTMRASLDNDAKGSLGVRLVADPGRANGFLIADVAPNGPSVGRLSSGDRLQAIDGHDLRKSLRVSLDSLLSGHPGSTAHLQILDQSGQRRELDVVREDVDAPTAYVTSSDGTKTEIRITSFGVDTASELREILKEETTGAVILDMRCNGGGYVKSAVECASLLLDQGSTVVTVDTPDESLEYRSEGRPVYDGNVCVLVNSKTASAAEIFTAALQFHLDAKVVGEKTYGKGSVQRIVNLPDDWALKVTTSTYRTAAGDFIDGVGITPDLLLDMPIASCRTAADSQRDLARLHLRHLANEGTPVF